jgi:PAS domain S-box-containing protein
MMDARKSPTTREEFDQIIDALRRSEERYHKMIAEVEDYAIILLDPHGIVQNWNKGAEKIKQFRESEIVGRHFSLFYLPEDLADDLPNKLLRKAAHEGRATQEGWRRRKDGSRFWGSITITALHNEDNSILGYSKVTRDLTERKLAEDAQRQTNEQLKLSNAELKKSEERYHQMIEEVQDYAIILLDIHGNIEQWNAGAQLIKGYSSEIIGQNFSVFYTREDQEKNLPQSLLAHARAHGKANHEGWRIRKDGTKFWGNIVITALHNKAGDVIGFSKVTRDLTEKKNAEDTLAAYSRELEVRNRELEQFAYIASHDLQEPLRKIRTFTDVIQRNLNDAELVKRYFEKINQSGERMTNLIRSVLTYSSITQEIAEAEVDLNQVVSQVLVDFELLITEKHADVSFGNFPVIRGNQQQLEQLFSNLISNALKFSGEHPLVKIKAGTVDRTRVVHCPDRFTDNAYLEIVISDNGIGFDPQYTDLIFSMFQRLETRNNYAGTGIGLALCKKIVENHGGFITATSTYGSGASFYVYFPEKRIVEQGAGQ